jgi:hypothetical protein
VANVSDFYACPVNANNIKHLPDLINGQALHHHATFSGSKTKLRHDFTQAARPTANIQLIYHKQMGTDPIGYFAYSETVSEKGTGLYLEDIYIRDNVRNHIRGAGSYGFYQLIDTALKGQMDYIQWAVAMNNEPATFSFYENKIGAARLDKTLYDLEDALQKGLLPVPELLNTNISTTRAGKSDLRAIKYRLESYNQTAQLPIAVKPLMKNIKTALNHHNADVYLCRNNIGEILGLTFSNANYSTFRTVTGIKAEPMVSLTHDALTYQQSMLSTAFAMRRDMYTSGQTGHFIWGVNSNDSLAHRFMTSQNADVLQMEGHNMASTLVMYGIKDQNISTKKRDSMIPKQP